MTTATEPLEEKQIVIVNNIQSPALKEDSLRTMTLYGDITEERTSEIVNGLLYLADTAPYSYLEEPDDPESKIIQANRDIKMYISTHGGVASEMFAIYDIMKMIQKQVCDIETCAVGKVMSAGVPILAAGTKGKRSIGRNCRIMLHNVLGGYHGNIFNMENELEEIRWIQERYIQCLTKNTKLTKTVLKKMLKTQTDIYISADQAIKYGIADKII